MGTKVWSGGAWVDLDSGGGSLSDQYPGGLLADGVSTGSSSRGNTNATANGTPHANGTYTEIDPSLSADASGIFIVIAGTTSVTNTDSSTLLEIATGAAASEVAWASVAVGYRDEGQRIFVPGFIASGTRVSVRVRSAIASKVINAFYSFLPATKSVDPGAPVTMGANTSTSRGVTVTAPGSLNTKGAWTEIEDSTSAAFGNLLVCIQGDGDTDTANSQNAIIDIGIGAAAAETVLIPDICIGYGGNEAIAIRSPLTYGVTVPAGSRLSARYARSSANNPVDLFLVGA